MLSDRARCEKPRILLCDSMDMKRPEQANPQRQKVDPQRQKGDERLPKGVRGGQVVTGSDSADGYMGVFRGRQKCSGIRQGG